MKSCLDAWNVVGKSDCSNCLRNGKRDIWQRRRNGGGVCASEVHDFVREVCHSSAASHGLIVDLDVGMYFVLVGSLCVQICIKQCGTVYVQLINCLALL